jgi:hypothetical protein
MIYNLVESLPLYPGGSFKVTIEILKGKKKKNPPMVTCFWQFQITFHAHIEMDRAGFYLITGVPSIYGHVSCMSSSGRFPSVGRLYASIW